jgi:Kef-type K+ transport system membrane component KefB/CBS domain-containing protein
MMPTLLSLGLLAFIAVGAGRLCARLHIPRVTGYLVAGLVGGPSAGALLGLPSLITREQLHHLEPLHDFALGLIVLAIGTSFHFCAMRRFGPKLALVSLAEMGLTAFLVGVAGWLLGLSWFGLVFLALMAVTTAPAATQMVVREYDSDGPLTDLVMTLIGINNLVAIVAFVLVLHFAASPDEPLWQALAQLVIPLCIGALGGAVMALMDQRLTVLTERQVFGLAMVGILVGLCRALDVSSLPATLAAGAVLVNASPHDRRLLKDLSGLDYPFYVAFFIMAGADLHLEALPHMGALGLAYVIARSLGKYLGGMIGSRAAGTAPACQMWLGPALLAQAGMAIGLAASLARDWGTQGQQIQTIILASVIVFEGVGPLLTRIALVQAGEVTVLSLLFQRSPVGYAEGLHQLVAQFRDSLGFPADKALEKPSDMLVGHVMRRNVEVVRHNLSFDGVLRTLGHSRYDRLPVVDDDDRLLGVIQYSDIAEVLFDPSLRNLVVAGDIVTQEHLLLTPDDTLEAAMEQLRLHPDHTYLLVVEGTNRNSLVGVVRHNDVLSAQRRLGRRGASS